MLAEISVRGSAHDAGEADGTVVVGDDEVFGVELPDGAVEGLERLAGGRAAYAEAARDGLQVVAVQRLTELEHDVVRDVDGE